MTTTAKGTIPLAAHMKAVDGLNQTIKRRENRIIELEANIAELEEDLESQKQFIRDTVGRLWEDEE